MKRFLRMLLFVCVLVTLLTVTAAAGKKETDISYPVTGGLIWFDKNTGTITGCSSDAGWEAQRDQITEAFIPREIDGVAVTSIGVSALAHCTNLTRVSLPDTLTTIKEKAFTGCAVHSIVIPDSVTVIEDDAFNGCTNLTSLVIGSHTSVIGEYAFYACSRLRNVVIPEGVTAIGDSAFCSCSSLSSVTLPDGLVSIGNSAFAGCSMTSVTIPESVTDMGPYLFSSCKNLLTATISGRCATIPREMFYGSGLISITIPDGVTTIGRDAFGRCSSLMSVEIPPSVAAIEKYAFRCCDSLTSIALPDGVTSVGEYAFAGCVFLNSVILPKSLTSIETSAFSGDTCLADVYYEGTKAELNAIQGLDNSCLLSDDWYERCPTIVHYNCNLSEISTEPPAITFQDVPKDSYFFIPVLWASHTGIAGGFTETTFSPHSTCTVAQTLTFIWRACLSPEPEIKNPFSNVSMSSYYAKAAVWACQEGLVESGVFHADEPCTRAMAVTYLWKLDGSQESFYNPNVAFGVEYRGENPFDDVPESAYFERAVVWSLHYGVAQGTSDTAFSPDNICSRAQIMTLLYRMSASGRLRSVRNNIYNI